MIMLTLHTEEGVATLNVLVRQHLFCKIGADCRPEREY